MEKVLNRRLAGALRYTLTALSIFPLVAANILNMRPFGSGYFFALVFCGVPYILVAPVYIFSELIIDFSVGNIVNVLVVAAVSIVGRLLLIKAKRGKLAISLAFAAVGQLGLTVMAANGDINLLQTFVWGMASIGVCFISMGVVRGVIINKLKYKLLETEVVGLCVLVAAAANGLSQFAPLGISIAAVVAIPCILIASYCGNLSSGLVCGISFGVGLALKDYNVTYIAAFAFTALIAGIFINAPRALSALAACMGFTIFTFFFNTYVSFSYFTILFMVVAALMYLLLPRKYLEGVKAFFNASHSVAAARSMVNRAKKNMGNSLVQSARIFNEMSASIGCADERKISFAGQLKNGVCTKCDLFDRCSKLKGFDDALDKVMETSAQKGRASVSQLPAFLSVNCSHLSKLIVFAGDRAEKNYSERIRLECEEAARSIVSEQLDGMASVLSELGKQASEPLDFDRAKERLILEELNYRGVIATEALIYGKQISIILRTETFSQDKIFAAAKSIMRAPYVLLSCEADEIAGFSIVTLNLAPKYDIVFSATSMPLKAGDKCGDSHSFIKIGSDKFMMALCDGMGSGEEAQKASETAINLVESFYKAGFAHSLVLNSVNKFLSLGMAERYSTLDICVIDLNDLSCDIIKFAAPATIIKSRDTSRSVEGAALPLGIVRDAKPDFYCEKLNVGDMVILTSDGISETFENQGLLHATNNLRTVNPSIVTNQLLEHVLATRGGVLKDDSTVLCARVYLRS